MKNKKFLNILVSLVQIAVSFECKQENEYMTVDGSCQKCEKCPPGYEPTQYHCGYGVKEPLYSCKPCEPGTFSLSTDYNFCRTCNPCKRWNTLTTLECTATSNSLCGACHSGYYRPIKTNGASDVECYKCHENSDRNCDAQTTYWSLIVTTLSIFCGVTCTLAVIFGCCLRKIIKTKATNEKLSPRNFSSHHRVHSCNLSTLTTSCELLNSKSKKNLQATERPLIEFDTETYSNRATAQFQQYEQYSQSPTAQFHSHPSKSGKNATLTCFEIDEQLRRNVGLFDTASVCNPSTSLPLMSV